MDNKYEFNGIENNNDFDLNYLEAFYRYMDVQTGRFLQIDPVTTHYESPYVMMGNNPIAKMDWLGNYFTSASDKEAKLYRDVRNKNSNQLSGYLDQIKDLMGKAISGQDVQNQINDVRKLINKCTELNTMWNDMHESNVEFHIMEDQSISDAGVTKYNKDNNRFDIKLKNSSATTSGIVLGHETRHGYVYLIGENVATTFGKTPLHDMMDEVAGYNTEIFMSGYIGVDKEVVNGTYTLDYLNSPGRPLADGGYDGIRTRTKQLTLNSPAADLLGATDDGFIKEYLRTNSGNTNLTVRDVLNAANKDQTDKGKQPVYIFGDALKNRNR